MAEYYVYVMTNKWSTALYTGVTNDLPRRVYEHKNKLAKGFTSKYNLDRLVYYETTDSVESAIAREKQIKSGSRASEVRLIERMNKDWLDLYERL